MFDIITFGSATRDMFVVSKNFQRLKDDVFATGKGLCVPQGAKIYVEDVIFATGGGGTNTAATFALQGLKTAYVGKVGGDAGGETILSELKKLNINTGFIVKDKKNKTAYSVVLSVPSGERSILVYEGACHELAKSDVSWKELKSEWFYISGLSGKSAELFEPLINFAHKEGIKIAVNPGADQLKLSINKLEPLLNKIDIFILNREEAAKLTCLPYNEEREIFKRLDVWVRGIAVMTKGPDGVKVSDGRNIYRAGIPESEILDRTGAGDAFGSGFVAGFIQKSSQTKIQPSIIEHAIQLGTANATSTVQHFGAKNGLLKKGEWGEWKKIEVKSFKI
ncbi:MAG: carbohydrate kinase family protein [Candidatus Portnoybacteria bacterium]|nr:carbohydrate kinase family protein [Candidatus Portnoybacteria bacterium]